MSSDPGHGSETRSPSSRGTRPRPRRRAARCVGASRGRWTRARGWWGRSTGRPARLPPGDQPRASGKSAKVRPCAARLSPGSWLQAPAERGETEARHGSHGPSGRRGSEPRGPGPVAVPDPWPFCFSAFSGPWSRSCHVCVQPLVQRKQTKSRNSNPRVREETRENCRNPLSEELTRPWY